MTKEIKYHQERISEIKDRIADNRRELEELKNSDAPGYLIPMKELEIKDNTKILRKHERQLKKLQNQ